MSEIKVDFSKIYSPSKIGMFDVCPKQYYFYYLDTIYSKMKNELKRQPHNIYHFFTLGRSVHNAITLFFHLSETERTEDYLLRNLKETWRSEFMPQKNPPLLEWGGFADIEEERNKYREAILMLKNFIKIMPQNPQILYLPTSDLKKSIDDYLGLISPLNERYDISGKFDLIIQHHQEPEIVDFKTSIKEEANPFQLHFYRLLAELKFKIPFKKASFYYLRSGNKKTFEIDNMMLQDLKEEINQRIEAIVSCQDFITKPSKLCKYCLFKPFCPAKEEVAKILNETKDDEFVDDLPF